MDLAGTKPPIWRPSSSSRRQIPDDVHAALQTAFSWDDNYLHEFVLDDRRARTCRRFARTEFELDVPFQEKTESTYHTPDSRMSSTSRENDWSTSTISATTGRPSWPRSRWSKGGPAISSPAGWPDAASRPDDSGGIWQHQFMMEAGLDPNHPDFAEAREWVKWAYGDTVPDPVAFDAKVTDQDILDLCRQE